MQKSKLLVFLAFILFLSGCETQLYTGLTEREGNDMLAILMDGGVSVRKELNKDNVLTLFVSNSEVSRSIQMLRNNGYPKDIFSSVKDIFPKDGLISSPTEERARYTYSMSQELSATLSMIDGVMTARVHIVLPQDTSGIQEDAYPSSASVFLKYTPGLELGGLVSKVKTLVANSIEGLSLDKINVSLFPSARVSRRSSHIVKQNMESFLSIQVSSESEPRLYLLVVSLFVLLLGVSGFCGWLFWQNRRKRKEGGTDDAMFPSEIENHNPT